MRIIPELGHAVRVERLPLAHIAILLDGGDGVGPIALDVVVAEAVKADLLDQPARQLQDLGIDVGIAVRQVGHVAERALVPALVHGRVEALPIPREFATLRFEQGPALLTGKGIDLGRIRAGVVIDDHVRDQTQPVAVRRLDETQ